MGRFLVQLGELVVEWSSVTDGPLTAGMTRDELVEYIREEYGQEGLRELPSRLERLDAVGTSLLSPPGKNARDAVLVNRAGPKERPLAFEQLVRQARLRREAHLSKRA